MKKLPTKHTLPVQASNQVEDLVRRAQTTVVPELPSANERYLRLLSENVRLRRQLRALQSPVRTDEQLDRALQDVRLFIASMTPEEGIVTCANLYDRAYFASIDGDRRYVVKLAQLLVASFRTATPLSEQAYKLWTHYAN